MNKSKIIIGITPLFDSDIYPMAMRGTYIGALERAGVLPVVIPMTENEQTLDAFVEMCDGIIMSGGQDIEPSEYGEEKAPHCGDIVPCRDKLDRYVYEKALKLDKPILGICRGCQAMNVFSGGSLYQDLKIDFGTDVNHRMEKPFNREYHSVIVQPDTPLAALLGERVLSVNSIHHQGVKHLADGYDIMAVSEDGVVEAIYMPQRKFVWGIQWHPEWFTENADCSAIINAFVKAAGA